MGTRTHKYTHYTQVTTTDNTQAPAHTCTHTIHRFQPTDNTQAPAHPSTHTLIHKLQQQITNRHLHTSRPTKCKLEQQITHRHSHTQVLYTHVTITDNTHAPAHKSTLYTSYNNKNKQAPAHTRRHTIIHKLQQLTNRHSHTQVHTFYTSYD